MRANEERTVMFGFNKPENEKLDACIDAILDSMKIYGPEAPEYPELLKSLERLNTMKSEDETKRRVSPEVIFTVAGNVLCVLIIVAYEQKHVITSRATTFIARMTNKPTMMH